LLIGGKLPKMRLLRRRLKNLLDALRENACGKKLNARSLKLKLKRHSSTLPRQSKEF
jgi:hypothetical protein